MSLYFQFQFGELNPGLYAYSFNVSMQHAANDQYLPKTEKKVAGQEYWRTKPNEKQKIPKQND